jgi:hypothetical protein
MHRSILAFPIVLSLAAAACGGTSNAPSPARTATIRVAGETYRVALTTADQVDAAEAARAGRGPRIPNGRLVAGTGVNTGWSWHVVDLEFADATIELCDGRPSDVEKAGPSYGGGRYCPWGATIVAIE